MLYKQTQASTIYQKLHFQTIKYLPEEKNVPLEYGVGNFKVCYPKQNRNHRTGVWFFYAECHLRHNLTSLTALSDSPTYLFINSGPCIKRKQLLVSS
jgi:hypothetical protein